MATDENGLSRIGKLTSTIQQGYPAAAAEYQRAKESLKLVRDDDSQQDYRTWQKLCSEYVDMLRELERLVLHRLPDTYAELRILPTTLRWHDIPELDWNVANAELIRIRAAAAAANADVPGVIDEPTNAPMKRKATVNALMLDALTTNPESRGWTVTQWQKQIHRSRGAIVKTETWTQLHAARKLIQAEHATTKRRVNKPRKK